MYNLVLGNIVDYYTTKVMVFKFFFLDINKHNGLDY